MTRIQNLLVKARRVEGVDAGTLGLVVGGVRDDDGETILVVDFCSGGPREVALESVEEVKVREEVEA